ncbi:hypothetical protein B0T14DRAFT_308343 [Immersiella caudata]|uniref:Uncharacterized protein n=1 Tax=Immersiella caudata TaxID=314043 RepID=A0AA40BUR4_9PEZI|nr:hypothetical protein B0T14DRAFT_308343 [Immersiella caudata]
MSREAYPNQLGPRLLFSPAEAAAHHLSNIAERSVGSRSWRPPSDSRGGSWEDRGCLGQQRQALRVEGSGMVCDVENGPFAPALLFREARSAPHFHRNDGGWRATGGKETPLCCMEMRQCSLGMQCRRRRWAIQWFVSFRLVPLVGRAHWQKAPKRDRLQERGAKKGLQSACGYSPILKPGNRTWHSTNCCRLHLTLKSAAIRNAWHV